MVWTALFVFVLKYKVVQSQSVIVLNNRDLHIYQNNCALTDCCYQWRALRATAGRYDTSVLFDFHV